MTKKKKQQQHRSSRSKRGLANADAETIRRVASAGGLAPHTLRGLTAIKDPEVIKKIATAGGIARSKDIESMSRAGKKGGNITKAEYGVEYFRELGRKGGGTTYEKYTATFYGDIGSKKPQKKEKS
jgi:general stress protein YciG